MESRAERLDRLLDDYKATRHVCSVNCCKYPCGSHLCTAECKNRSPSPCCRSSPIKCHSPYVPMPHRCSPSCCISTCPAHFCSPICHCATCLCRDCCNRRIKEQGHQCDEKCCVSNCTEHLLTCQGTRCWCFGCRCQKCLERIAGFGEPVKPQAQEESKEVKQESPQKTQNEVVLPEKKVKKNTPPAEELSV